MTVVIALTGKKSIWLATDRRITYPHKQDNAGVKTIAMEGVDGCALLGYAGLGATASQVQPSVWMRDLLVGRTGFNVEQCLSVIAEAMKADMPRHLSGLPGGRFHSLLAPALVDGKPQLYSVSIDIGKDGSDLRLICARHTAPGPGNRAARLLIAGSGGSHIMPVRQWHRKLFRLLVAHEQGQLSDVLIADQLASLVKKASLSDPFVSSDCIVQWRSVSGGFQFYSQGIRVDSNAAIPMVCNGMDVNAIGDALFSLAPEHFAAARRGEQIDGSRIQAEINKRYSIPRAKL